MVWNRINDPINAEIKEEGSVSWWARCIIHGQHSVSQTIPGYNIFVNLKTGERIDYNCDLFFDTQSLDCRLTYGYLKGYSGASDEHYLYDISDIRNINLLFKETSDTAEYYFDEQSRFVAKYKYDFYKYKDITTNSYDEICDAVIRDKGLLQFSLDDSALWRAGVLIFENEDALVVRVPDPTKITPFSNDKGDVRYSFPGFAERVKELRDSGVDFCKANNKANDEHFEAHREFLKPYINKYGNLNVLDETKVVEVIASDRFKEFEKYIVY